MTTDSKLPLPLRDQAAARIVLDTNVLISALLFPQSSSTRAMQAAFNHYQVVFSIATWDEFAITLQRSKFDKYVTSTQRNVYLEAIASRIYLFEVTTVVSDCRDPKDNKFLALAIDACAQTVVTGDDDLLVLNPYSFKKQHIQLITVFDFLSTTSQQAEPTEFIESSEPTANFPSI